MYLLFSYSEYSERFIPYRGLGSTKVEYSSPGEQIMTF